MMDDILQQASGWSSIIVLLAQCVFGWLLYALRKEFVTAKKCEEKRASCAERWENLDDEQLRLERADATLAAKLEAIPPGQEIRGLRVDMAELSGEVKALDAKVTGQGNAIARIEKNLDMLMQHHMGK